MGDQPLGERHVRFHGWHIHFGHKGDFTEIALPFTILILQQVALAFFAAKQLACGSHFEPFGDGFTGFGDACVFGHRGGEDRGDLTSCKGFLSDF